ncbi:MAG: hypothetical protein AAGJ82_11380 [Bacteroidota bacterium]
MSNIKQRGDLDVVIGGSTVTYTVDKEADGVNQVVVEVFQCDGCPGFCGPFGVEHYARQGSKDGECNTQPPYQSGCF